MKWSEIKEIAAKELKEQDEHWGFLCSFEKEEWDKIAAVVDAARYVYGSEREGFSKYETRVSVKAMRLLDEALEALDK